MSSPPPSSLFHLTPLSSDAVAFRKLTFPRLGKVLEALKEPWFAVGAWNGSLAAGLALGHAGPEGAILTSIFVAPELRGQRLGLRLLAAFEDEARAHGARRLHVRYAAAMKAASALAGRLGRGGWERPEVLELSLVGEVGKMVASVGTWPGVTTWL